MNSLVVILACALWGVNSYPYYPYYGNMDSLSLGSVDNSRGGMVLSRYYNPYYNPRAVGGMAAFMFRPPETQAQQAYQPNQYYVPERRRQTQDPNQLPTQENEIFYQPTPTENLLADPTEKYEPSTTAKAVTPELAEAEADDIDEPVRKPRKRVSKKKQEKRPVEEDDEEGEPQMPKGTFFPIFFGYGRSGGSSPGGATAIANAYSTGRGGVATSHATAYGTPPIDFKTYQQRMKNYDV